jgi:hypothetical protein
MTFDDFSCNLIDKCTRLVKCICVLYRKFWPWLELCLPAPGIICAREGTASVPMSLENLFAKRLRSFLSPLCGTRLCWVAEIGVTVMRIQSSTHRDPSRSYVQGDSLLFL